MMTTGVLSKANLLALTDTVIKFVERSGFCGAAQVELLLILTGAGEGNRTLVVSLGSFCSTIELHPRCQHSTRVCEGLTNSQPKCAHVLVSHARSITSLG